MAEKGNTFRRNSATNQVKRNPTVSNRVDKKRKSNPTPVGPIVEKGIKILGLFLILISAFFFISFISYLFTWEEDQSYVSASNGGWNTLFMTKSEIQELGIENTTIQNWMGKLGALLSHELIYKGFGLASFTWVFFLLPIGIRLLFKVKLVSIWKLIGYSLFLIVFISVFFGFIHSFISQVPHFLEGEFGFWTNRLLEAQIGKTGVGALLIFVLLTFLIIVFNLEFKINLPKKQQLAEDKEGISNENNEAFAPKMENQSVAAERRPLHNERLVAEVLETEEKEEEILNLEFEVDEKVSQISDQIKKEEVEAPKFIGNLEIANAESTETNNSEDAAELQVTQIKEEKPSTSNDLVEQFGEYDPKLDLSGYQYPTLDLLKDYGKGKITINNDELQANKDKIVETLGNYNIEIAKIKATIGPTVTLYEIIPKPGVRISKIKNLEDDIALSLAALGIRIIAPMPGKGTIGIEVPNSHPEMVSMKSVLATEKFQHTNMDLPIALGKTISNEVYIADLAKMPHLLVAGATGQGKSVGINAILTSLLYKKHPAELKFVLVDPKKVELSLFKKIEKHFLAKLPDEEEAIITDTKKVINTLVSLCKEMDLRYDLLKNAQVRNLKEYNTKFINRRLNPNDGHRFLPFIVLVVDEFADLMMTAGKEVETPIARLAQLARAVGIHLVIATQRPSVNIITGTIKANFPARLAFRVLSKVDSRTILDTGGADQLIGRGDMLLSTGSDLIRLQCAFVDTPEVDEISNFIGSQRGYPSAFLLPEVHEEGEGGGMDSFEMSDRDPLFEDAARLIIMHQQGSTSLIQRKMKLGYNRAGRIMDQLEAAGIVGPSEGSKAREVLFPDEYALEQFLDRNNKE